MRRVIWLALAASILLGSSLYSILTTSISENPNLALMLPLNIVFLIATLYLSFRVLFHKGDLSRLSLYIALRQGLLVGIVVGAMLYLQGLRVLTVLDSILIIAAAFVLELFFQSEKIDQRTPKNE